MDDESSISSDEEEYLTLVRDTFLTLLHLPRLLRLLSNPIIILAWVRSIYRRRCQQGDFHSLLQEMRLSDPESHFRYMRMSRERFDSLLQMVTPLLSHRGYFSPLRPEILPAERLALTIRYLATGNSQVSLSFSFRMGKSTVCSILKETCEALWTVLEEQYVKPPLSAVEWERIAKEFWQRWNFPNCIGAIDGKHIVVQAPRNCGSLYYNYKGTHSVVLMAVCDANYRFTLVDLGEVGRRSDGGVFSNSSFGEALEDGSMALPEPASLPESTAPDLPFVLVGDEAFPLKNYMLRPYPGRNLPDDQAVFNYRLSRARRVIENSFGILAARWRLFRQSIIAKPENVVRYSKAAIALHNYLRTTEAGLYCPPGYIDGEDGSGNIIEGQWRRDEEACTSMQPVTRTGSNRYSRSASATRGLFKDYFVSSRGTVSWQLAHINRTQ